MFARAVTFARERIAKGEDGRFMPAECLLLYYVSARIMLASFLRDLPAISRGGNNPEDTDRTLFIGSFVPRRTLARAYASRAWKRSSFQRND